MDSFMVKLVCALALMAAVMAAPERSKKCQRKCEKCPTLEPQECLAGMEKDPECNCCDICSRYEGQKCDLEGAEHKHGKCGDGLECRKAGKNNICQCHWDEIVCGTDGITYTNVCQLMATAVRENKHELEVKILGPCDPGAVIVTKPEYVRNSTGSNVVILCEARGFPTPHLYWTVKRADGHVSNIPGDDNFVLTAMRGGPGKYQVTGWMQIEGLKKQHEGDYTCHVENKHSKDEATARIKVK